MMRSTFMGLEVSKRALFAQQAALTTTGHNIANANTEGYTRQVVNFVAARPIEAPGMTHSAIPGQMGQSVEFDHILRVREQFLDDQYYNENKNLGTWSVRKDTLEKLEGIINEPSDTGIRQTIEAFWSSWQELSKSPENATTRVLVKERALAMTDSLNHTSKQLSDLSSDLTSTINIKAQEVSTSLSSISRLNQEIYRIEGLGDDANDLRDQRDLLVDKLSQLVNVTRTEEENGYHIKMGNIDLVQGRDVLVEPADMVATLTGAFNQTDPEAGDLNSGEIHGMIYSRDKTVADYQKQLDNMVQTLVEGDLKITLPAGAVIPTGTILTKSDGTTQSFTGTVGQRTLDTEMEVTVKGINGLHALGYNGDSAQSGVPFFTFKTGATSFTADSITVNSVIVNNVNKISSSMRTAEVKDALGNVVGESVIQGNNDMALLMASVRNIKLNYDPSSAGSTVLVTGTTDEYFRAMVGQLGVQSQEAKRQTNNQQILVDQVNSRRQAVSGVSLDEEMANMIKFQQAYNAAARAMTTYDECLDKIINGMGLVGR